MQKYDYFLAPEQLTSDTDLIIRNVGFSQCRSEEHTSELQSH